MQCPECGKPHTLSKHASHEARLARWRAQPPGPTGEKTDRVWAAPRKAPKRAHPWEDHTGLLADLRDDSYGYVYRLYDARGVIIYVGQTKGALAVRLAAHAVDKSWWPEVAAVKAYRVRAGRLRSGMTRLDRMERAEIRLWEPKYNQLRYGEPLSAHVPESTVAGFRRFGEPGKEQVIP